MALKLNDPDLLRHQAYINGEWVDADSGATTAVTNPATGETIVDVAMVGAAETERAIAAADEAMREWKTRPAKARAQVLRRWYDLMMEHQEDLAVIMTAEQGKVLAESRAEIAYGAAFVEWFGEEAKRINGDVIPGPSADKRIVCIKQPVGVVGAITPWNFPNAMLARKAAPALAAGCSIVVKPATATPLSAFAMAELAQRAGVPAGVLNVLCGSSSEIGNALTASPVVRKLTFTGSTPVGKKLMEQSAATMKKLSMELGGNAPFVVFDDADIDAAVEGAMVSKYRNAGQTCVCTNRLFVQDDVYDEFVAKFVEAAKTLVVGNGMDEGVTVGPLVSSSALNDVDALVQTSISQGATVALGGGPHALGGCFYQPTILTDVTPDMAVFRNEIFGPVLPVLRFSTEAELIEMANDTEFGLASYFYARDIGRIWRVAEALEYGMVGINSGMISNEMAPFGGVKESGMGREGSIYGMDDYVEIKYLLMGGI
ncbi:MAG: NAD-dependent succinate-semialdehyde dehydrogenase [Halieaceae bacterium]|jgi:succinate-semialdehyde dehydrogenase/glutarate-semialdehyde dehydrogenase|nr:NAD-dependent succinate-semialdehyde dehydrogenase [Halieaceae bacterium]